MRLHILALGLLCALTTTAAASAEDPKDTGPAAELIDQAARLANAGHPQEALPLIDRALSLCENALPPDDPNLVMAEQNAARVHLAVGDTARACTLYARAEESLARSAGPETGVYADALREHAVCVSEAGDRAGAEGMLARAVSILEKVSPPAEDSLATALEELGRMKRRDAAFPEARALFERALAIVVRAKGADSIDVADVAASLGRICADMEDAAGALEALQRAYRIYLATYGKDDPRVALLDVDLARLDAIVNRLEEADALYTQATEVLERALGADARELPGIWVQHALVKIDRGDDGGAEALLRRALASPNGAPEAPGALLLLCELARRRGDFAAAERFAEEARQKAGSDADAGMAVEILVAVLRIARGDVAGAVARLARFEDALDVILRAGLAIGDDQARAAFVGQFAADRHAFVGMHLALAPRDRALGRLALLAVLRHKGMELDASMNVVQALRRRASPEARALLDRLVATQVAYAKATLGGASPEERERLGGEARALAAQAAESSAAVREATEPVTVERVAAAIPEDAALVEIVEYAPVDPRAKGKLDAGPRRYAAYVLRRAGEPRWTDLGDVATIDAAVRAFRDVLATDAKDPKPAARALDALVMQPVRPLLGGARRLFVAPDGALNLVPFAALVDERGGYLVDTYSIAYLAGGRDLLRAPATRATTAPVVLADPDFGPPTTGPGPHLRLEPIPATLAEARAIRALAGDAVVLTGREATKAALEGVHAPRFLHLATHGAFLDEANARALAHARGLVLDTRGAQGPDVSPLLRSLLALASANEGPDGLVTALEASSLDLEGTKLVTLSACETGLGDVRAGDGVYGLRRAFAVAGAESLVMSLWPVSDDATRDLMAAYYANLQGGAGRAEALRGAQTSLVSKWSHPHYWAAFIASGNARTMDERDPPPLPPLAGRVDARPHACGCRVAGAPSAGSPLALLFAAAALLTRVARAGSPAARRRARAPRGTPRSRAARARAARRRP